MNVKINPVILCHMVSPTLVIATVLAGVDFALALFGMIEENSITGMQAGHASLAASHLPA